MLALSAQVRVPRGPGVQDTPFTLAVVGDIGQVREDRRGTKMEPKA